MTNNQEEFLKKLSKGNEFLESIFKKGKPVFQNGKDELESLVQDLFAKIENAAIFIPRTNIKETKESFFLEVEVPGVNKEDIEILIDKDTLVISGKRTQNLIEAEKYTKIETFYGKFERRFNLPVEIEKEFIEGKVENGILFVEIPKKIEAKEDIIKVNVR